MKYIFCGNLFSDIENDVKKMKVPPPVSSHKYQSNIIQGLMDNRQEIYIINIPRLRYYPHYPKIFVQKHPFIYSGHTCGVNVGFINLPILNYISQRVFLERELRTIVSREQENLFTLISFNNYLPQSLAMLSVRQRFQNVVLCNILGDLHGKFGIKIPSRHDGLRGFIIRKIEKKQDQLSGQFDAFGFLTQYMPSALGVSNKPYVIIEGIYSGNVITFDVKETPYKTVFYAGAIEEEYGIAHLLNAFSQIQDANYRLEIAGSGSAVALVKSMAKRDKRIMYLGYITPKEVAYHQQNATVLVNPRISNYKYIKYSFPSKTMECLASGKPYIAHDLICNPPEYKQYIQQPQNESDEALRDEIIRVCSLPDTERANIGKRAKEFILREKNPKMQCQKIISMMKQFEGKFKMRC